VKYICKAGTERVRALNYALSLSESCEREARGDRCKALESSGPGEHSECEVRPWSGILDGIMMCSVHVCRVSPQPQGLMGVHTGALRRSL
jgi:hypothetical protein